MSKLNILCGEKIMGWNLSDPESPWPPGWNPGESLEDALVCLERAFWKDGKKQFWFFKYWKGGYSCGPLSSEWAVTAVEPQIAMCLCSLRAMGVPESEISLAMEI